MKARLLAVAVILNASAPVLRAQEATGSGPSDPGPATPARAVSRTEVALAYLRFDRAYATTALEGVDLVRVNRRFDSMTRLLFLRRFAEAVVALNDLTVSLSAIDERAAAPAAGSTWTARLEPAVWISGSAAPPRLRVVDLSAMGDRAPEAVELRLRDGAGHEVFWRALAPDDLRTAMTTGLPLAGFPASLAPGRLGLELRGESWHPAGVLTRPFDVVERSLDDVRRENEERLAAIATSSDDLLRAVAIASTRNGLLRDRSGPESSTALVGEPGRLAAAVRTEIDRLSEGRNPYHRLAGDHWRVVIVGDQMIPVRVFAPIEEGPDQPRPLVIALHGAGGDENLFMDGYGAGMLKELASRHGFVAAAPLTYGFMASTSPFDRLLLDLKSDFAINHDRVYVLGHSLGAIATVGLASGRPGVIAAACCIAGFRPIPIATDCAPILVLGAELDPIFPPARIGGAVERAVRAGLPIESRVLDDQGHTLVVNEALPLAIDWLMTRRLTDRHKPGD